MQTYHGINPSKLQMSSLQLDASFVTKTSVFIRYLLFSNTCLLRNPSYQIRRVQKITKIIESRMYSLFTFPQLFKPSRPHAVIKILHECQREFYVLKLPINNLFLVVRGKQSVCKRGISCIILHIYFLYLFRTLGMSIHICTSNCISIMYLNLYLCVYVYTSISMCLYLYSITRIPTSKSAASSLHCGPRCVDNMFASSLSTPLLVLCELKPFACFPALISPNPKNVVVFLFKPLPRRMRHAQKVSQAQQWKS